MNKAPFAKALTKHAYQLGAPAKILFLGLIPGLLIWLITKWLWYLVVLEIPWFLFIKYKYEKDEYWLAYMKDALSQKTHLEP